MIFNKIYNNILIENKLKQHVNQNIAIMAGSFRIPFKYDIDLINQLLQITNKVVIIISGISKQNIENRELSKTNIDRLANIFSQYKFTNQMKYIIQNIQKLTFKKLKQLLLNLKCSKQFKDKILQYIKSTQKKIYSSLITYNNIQLTPNIIIDLFNILIDDYRIQYVIAEQQSPIIDAIRYVNTNCLNCNIKLVTIDNINETMTTWQSLLNLFNDENNIEEYFPHVKYKIDRKIVIKNLDNGLKYFQNASQYNQIKEYFI